MKVFLNTIRKFVLNRGRIKVKINGDNSFINPVNENCLRYTDETCVFYTDNSVVEYATS